MQFKISPHATIITKQSAISNLILNSITGKLLPVRHQSIVFTTKHCPDVGCVMDGRVEVSVVS